MPCVAGRTVETSFRKFATIHCGPNQPFLTARRKLDLHSGTDSLSAPRELTVTCLSRSITTVESKMR